MWSAALVEFVKKRDVDVNRRDKHGNTALHYVAQYFSPRCAIALMELGANPHLCNGNLNFKPMHHAAIAMSESEFVRWIPYGIDAYTEYLFDTHHTTTFAALVARHHHTILKKAIAIDSAKGVETVLHHVRMSTEELFELLLVSCAEHRALQCAVVIAETLKLVQNKDDRLNTTLHYAAEYPFLHPVFNDILQLWPNEHIDIPNCYGETPLHFAMTTSELNYRMCKSLITRGADPNRCDLDGLSPMLSGTGYMRKWVTRNTSGYYRDFVAAIHTIDLNFFETHMHHMPNPYGVFLVAARLERHSVLRWFITKFETGDFSIHLSSPRGDTVLHVIVRHAPLFITAALQLGADPLRANNDGVTPLQLAKERKLAHYF